MSSRADGLTLRNAQRVVRRMMEAESGQRRRVKPEALPLTGLGSPPPPDAEFEDRLAEAYQDNKLCLVCLGVTDAFYLIAGSGEFYMKQLARLGVPPEYALRIAARYKGSPRLNGMRRTPCCPRCATLAGMEKMPASSTEIGLRAADGLGKEQPVPVAILGESEEVIQSIVGTLKAADRKHDQARRKQEEYMARLKGAQKDVADFIEKLEQGKVAGLEGLGYLSDISNGHIKIYFGEPGRATASDGRFITTISSTPRNAKRTVDNAEGLLKRWERENLNTEPEPAAAAEENDDEMSREYRQWSDYKKAAMIARYDDADDQGQRDLLEKNRIRHRDITRFREQLAESGTFRVAPAPVPLPDEPSREQMCSACGKDKALTRDNFAQPKASGKYAWSKKCRECESTVIKPPVEIAPDGTIRDGGARVAAAASAGIETIRVAVKDDDAHMGEDEAKTVVRLMGRQREIKARLSVIGAEKAAYIRELQEQMARATAKLDAEKAALSTELDQVQTELLEVVAG